MEMTADRMLEILKRDYGINSREEFYEAFRQMPKIDIGLFTKGRRDEESTGSDNDSGSTCADTV